MQPLETDNTPGKNVFIEKVKMWSDNASASDFPDWEDQVRILSEIGELITPELSLKEMIAVIYASVNELMDAYQFGVGVYNNIEGVIHYKAVIENGQYFPELIVDVVDDNRFASWCIRHESEMFMNDVETEYSRYLKKVPNPLSGSAPKAALYVPLRMNGNVTALITVRSIHRNVYKKHHLYILKTLGNFLLKSLALSEERDKRPPSQNQQGQKNWRWCSGEEISPRNKKLLASLTVREKDVLILLASGYSYKAIAEKLFVSPGTIKTHVLNVYKKMEVKTRTSAILKAIELNWFV
jgi:DNA-binding CsgD family transcriptional regulator